MIREAQMLACRGVRGATTVAANTKEEILSATRELLKEIMAANDFKVDDVASTFFTTTVDLNAEFPAAAARQLGWNHVALLDSHEMAVPGSLPMCIRVLVHVNTEKAAKDIIHVYMRGAKNLRGPVPPVPPEELDNVASKSERGGR